MKPTEEQIEKIAEEMECGMVCFFNTRTGEIRTILSAEDLFDDDEGFWAKEREEIEKDRDNFYEFENPESSDSFEIMEEFTESVKEPSLRSKLVESLHGPKPFRNFKVMIDQAGKYREEWFAFKSEWYIEWVKDQIDGNERFEK